MVLQVSLQRSSQFALELWQCCESQTRRQYGDRRDSFGCGVVREGPGAVESHTQIMLCYDWVRVSA